MTRVRMVALVGPTASGKTALGMALAQRVGAEIVSADARQIYRGLDVGTGKPSVEERRRVPHHCLDLVDPRARFDVARYRAAALTAVGEVTARGRHVVVAGGTGLYVRALLRGLCGGVPASPPWRAALERAEAERPGLLVRWCRRLDPAAAARIHDHDHVRLLRALEVALVSGRPLSDWQRRHAFAETPFDVLTIGLAVPPPVLEQRIAARVHAMLAQGWLAEVAALATWLPADAPAWRTLGYRELRAVVGGERTLDDAVAATIRATRRFAKRQRTWFHHEAGVCWRDPMTEQARLLDEAAAFLVANPRNAR